MANKKNGPIKDKEKTDMSASDQKRVNREWENMNKKKLGKGENAAISEAAYKDWKSTGKLNYTYYNPKDKEPAPKKEEITAKLQTKKIQQTPIDKNIVKSKTEKKTAEAKPTYTPEAKTKKLTKGGGRTGNVGTAVKNVIGKQVFKREEKLASAYKRATSTAGTGSQAGQGKIERRNELKGQIKDLKSARKATGVDVRSDIKDTKKAIKWSDKVGSNSNRYLNISGRKK
jgi:hypothetical protein